MCSIITHYIHRYVHSPIQLVPMDSSLIISYRSPPLATYLDMSNVYFLSGLIGSYDGNLHSEQRIVADFTLDPTAFFLS
ncbi:unnamed protein product [Macrosiphum euphorbiae]|uniref:Uncharacterized protein n=1 Tax=Macrosiphum euphorbiae TaxID=13131 RepID=A0AAV0XAE3_9HEMI|nr:unnamed protein product [Macrosiphum euphorbiae]